MFIPSQVKQQPIINSSTYSQVQQKLSSVPPPPVPPMIIPPFTPPVVAQPQQIEKSYSTEPTPVVLSSAPKLYTNRPSPSVSAPVQPAVMDISSLQFEVTTKLKKLKTEKPSGPNPIAEAAIQAAKASSALQNFGHEDRKGKKNRKTIRMAGGQVWEDPSLADWPDDDFRIFCGDLGNDVNDELLTRTFNKYPSFQKAKVLRDKRTGKSKGFGFISFKEPQDFIRAMKEMDGKFLFYLISTLLPCKWRERDALAKGTPAVGDK